MYFSTENEGPVNASETTHEPYKRPTGPPRSKIVEYKTTTHAQVAHIITFMPFIREIYLRFFKRMDLPGKHKL